jgi:hypothetical protein
VNPIERQLLDVISVLAYTAPVGLPLTVVSALVMIAALGRLETCGNRLVLAAALSVFTLAIFGLGVIYRHSGASEGAARNDVALYACIALAGIQLACSVLLVIRSRGMRVMVSSLCAIELWIGFCTLVVSEMAIAGDWL